jgi:hypothetical protein
VKTWTKTTSPYNDLRYKLIDRGVIDLDNRTILAHPLCALKGLSDGVYLDFAINKFQEPSSDRLYVFIQLQEHEHF